MAKTYMFIRITEYSMSLKDQLSIAENAGIIEEHLIGSGMYRDVNTVDILDLIGRPLKAGDTLYVSNLLLVGQRFQRILDAINRYHAARIKLHIVDIDYIDDVPAEGNPKSKNDDYSKLCRFLRVFIAENERRNRKRYIISSDSSPRGKGRPKKNLASLPPKCIDLIEKHFRNLYVYSEKQLLADIVDPKIGNYPLSLSTLRLILKEYRERYKRK